MKKSNLKSLKLNKRSISNLESGQVKGGTSIAACTTTLITWIICPPDKPKKIDPEETEYETCISFICN